HTNFSRGPSDLEKAILSTSMAFSAYLLILTLEGFCCANLTTLCYSSKEIKLLMNELDEEKRIRLTLQLGDIRSASTKKPADAACHFLKVKF
uniref:Uncharacterized protein n=1 Tax=Haplochromis burtoni TaxID=8153 RepID=A0A3Q3CZ51_HAPBU